MRSLGTSLILIALALVQVPFITCHSDCRADCLPLWAFEGHHCHDAEATDQDHDHGCACEHQHVEPLEESDPDGSGDDHGPGDHELVFAAVSTFVGASAPAWESDSYTGVSFQETAVTASVFAGSTAKTRDTGPPVLPFLETVRLLL